MLEGSLDRVTTTNATGWLYDRVERSTAEVVAKLHGRAIGSAPSNLYRPDLEAVGFGDGLCGFDVSFDEIVKTSDLAFITVHPVGSNLSIPRTNEESYRDLVLGFLRQHSGSGRSRSVLGGLWTDRTDALQILAGKINIGTCPIELKDALRHLIGDGFFQMQVDKSKPSPVPDVSVPALNWERSENVSALAIATHELQSLNDFAAIFSIFRSVFDDVPVMYGAEFCHEGVSGFTQAPMLERFVSPNELLALYLGVDVGQNSRIDYILDSQSFPEFDVRGASRWLGNDETDTQKVVFGERQPILTVEMQTGQAVIVGPGLIHRVIRSRSDRVIRCVFAPKRNVPVRYHDSRVVWQELPLSDGTRIRVEQNLS